MKYRLLGWLLLLPLLLMAQERPKVAVVLSGGGAKGTAHIGALKVIEKAGIPIDYVVGTSMGAIVGGLYAIGYTPEQLDSMVNVQNWKFVLSDAPNPKDVLLDDRLRSERYVLSIPFTLKSADISDAGIIKGKNIAQLFSVLTEGYQDSVNLAGCLFRSHVSPKIWWMGARLCFTEVCWLRPCAPVCRYPGYLHLSI